LVLTPDPEEPSSALFSVLDRYQSAFGYFEGTGYKIVIFRYWFLALLFSVLPAVWIVKRGLWRRAVVVVPNAEEKAAAQQP